jgi:hypothetical protein
LALVETVVLTGQAFDKMNTGFSFDKLRTSGQGFLAGYLGGRAKIQKILRNLR